MLVTPVFEAELKKRGLEFSIDPQSDRHVLTIEGGTILVSLENLEREYSREPNASVVVRFVDLVVEAASKASEPKTKEGLFWSLDTTDYAEELDYTLPISEGAQRILAHHSERGITLVSPAMLDELGLTPGEAFEIASDNQNGLLQQARLDFQDIDGVRLAYFDTEFVCKASLLLGTGLKAMVEPIIGWPILAVAPDRNFCYLWSAREVEFANRLGNVVIREYEGAGYPISLEVFEIGDLGIRPLGSFQKS